jgi:DNA polymerase I-like protein with 3'-5' exonuclease and polymerase domains
MTPDMSSKLVSTVHDSIVIDAPSNEVDKVCELVYNTWSCIPMEFARRFNEPFNLPMRVEIQVGPDWGNMEDYPHAN